MYFQGQLSPTAFNSVSTESKTDSLPANTVTNASCEGLIYFWVAFLAERSLEVRPQETEAIL